MIVTEVQDLHNQREKRKSNGHSFVVTEQFGRDVQDFRVELNTGLSTMVNIVEDDDSGCEPKRKQVPQKSKLFISRLVNARSSKHVFKIRNVESMNAENCKFEIGSGNSARTFYQVHICTQPSCSCPDFNTCGMRSSCKHILFALAVTDINLLDKTEFQIHEVVNFLKKFNIDSAFKAKKATGTEAKKKSTAQFREILNTYSDSNAPQTLDVVKINRSISCSRLNCKNPIDRRSVCQRDRALSVPFGKEHTVKKLFFFCPKQLCITRPSV